MVRTWGPFEDAAALGAVLPTLQQWAELLEGDSPEAGSSAAGGSSSTRQPFRPPAVAVWRALHGVLPLLQGGTGEALVQHVPHLAAAVLAWVGGRREDGELCTWFAVSCWAHLLAAVGPAAFHHTTASAAAIVQQLAATAAGSGSERLHKAAAEAVGAMLLHAASGDCSCGEAVAALRRGLLFLLHDIPQSAAAASPAGQQQQQPQQPQQGFSQLTAAVAEAAAFSTLLQLLGQGGSAAEAALRCAHYWVQPLCASLRQRGVDAAVAQPPLRSPTLFAAADKVALRLAAALLAGEAAALSGTAGSDSDAAVAAVAVVAAEQAGAWQCIPALWCTLAAATGNQECSALLLGAAAALSKSTSQGGASASAAVAGAAPLPAGFAAPVLASTLGSEIAAARRPLPPQALRGYCLHEGEHQLCICLDDMLCFGKVHSSALVGCGCCPHPESLSRLLVSCPARCAPTPQMHPSLRRRLFQCTAALRSYPSSFSRLPPSTWPSWRSAAGAAQVQRRLQVSGTGQPTLSSGRQRWRCRLPGCCGHLTCCCGQRLRSMQWRPPGRVQPQLQPLCSLSCTQGSHRCCSHCSPSWPSSQARHSRQHCRRQPAPTALCASSHKRGGQQHPSSSGHSHQAGVRLSSPSRAVQQATPAGSPRRAVQQQLGRVHRQTSLT